MHFSMWSELDTWLFNQSYCLHRMSELQEVRQEIIEIKQKADVAERAGNNELLLVYQKQLVPLREKEERLAAAGGEICSGTHATTIAQTQLPLFHRYTPPLNPNL